MSDLAAPSNVPTLDEVRDKIERRYAVALGTAELAKESPATHVLEVQKATLDMAGAARLEEIRAALAADTPAVEAAASDALEADTPAAIEAPAVDTTKSGTAAAKKAAPVKKAAAKKAPAKKAAAKKAPAKKAAAKEAPPAPDAG
jgi:hypothetical protein